MAEWRLQMKRLATLPLAAALLLLAAPAVSARADTYYTVVCDDGNVYESVDAHAVELGHKDDAVTRFTENTPFGLTCWLDGPFTS
jgi:outer membrane protein assembly factor BamE (lipoprotein component of BamABCDE complex)